MDNADDMPDMARTWLPNFIKYYITIINDHLWSESMNS